MINKRESNLKKRIIIFSIVITMAFTIFSLFKIFRKENESKYEVLDYKQYIGKVWVPENYDKDIYNSIYDFWNDWPSSFSFYISRIEDGIIEGKFCVGMPNWDVSVPDCYSVTWESKLGDFAGNICDGNAESVFVDTCLSYWNDDGGGNSGTNGKLKFEFSSSNTINVTVEYINDTKHSDIKLILNYS